MYYKNKTVVFIDDVWGKNSKCKKQFTRLNPELFSSQKFVHLNSVEVLTGGFANKHKPKNKSI